jgi:hypothetical protein
MTVGSDKLRDVHAPARFIDGEIHWQMACGPDAIDASISATALHLLGPKPLPSYLDVFEQNRTVLCELAAHKFSPRSLRKVEIERDDVLQILNEGLLRPNDSEDDKQRSDSYPPR